MLFLILATMMAHASTDPVVATDQGWAEVAAVAELDVDTVQRLVGSAELQPEVLSRMATPWEAKPWAEYGPIFLDDKRIANGAAFWSTHRARLEQAEAETGVPVEIIVAILGVETRYGGVMGSDRVADALYTLGFYHPRRGAFFRKELGHFARLCHDQGWEASDRLGSYAGAMGMAQFMPSSYRAWAVDGNDDGSRDLFGTPDDAIASVANYLKAHGWKRGEPILFPVKGEPDTLAAQHSKGLKRNTTWGDLSDAGVRSAEPLAPESPVRLFRFQAESGPEYRVGRTNFYVITRYNHSALYARAVFELSERIRAKVDVP